MTLAELITRLNAVAEAKQVSESLDVLVTMKINSLVDEYSWIAAQFGEPSEAQVPLDVFWLDLDPESATFNKLLQRSSRSGGTDKEGQWSEVTVADRVAEDAHIWDLGKPEDYVARSHWHDISDPHFQEPVGGQLRTALKPRTISGAEEYSDVEVAPYGIIRAIIGAAVSLTNRVSQKLNYTNLKLRLLTDRVVVLEADIAKGYSHEQAEGLKEWTIEHNLNSENIMVDVFNASKQKVYPSSVEIVNENSISILFAVNVLGRANIRPV
jgi:hypothetical protein